MGLAAGHHGRPCWAWAGRGRGPHIGRLLLRPGSLPSGRSTPILPGPDAVPSTKLPALGSQQSVHVPPVLLVPLQRTAKATAKRKMRDWTRARGIAWSAGSAAHPAGGQCPAAVGAAAASGGATAAATWRQVEAAAAWAVLGADDRTPAGQVQMHVSEFEQPVPSITRCKTHAVLLDAAAFNAEDTQLERGSAHRKCGQLARSSRSMTPWQGGTGALPQVECARSCSLP